jgi:hypothetical protein
VSEKVTILLLFRTCFSPPEGLATAQSVSTTEVGSNYAALSWTAAQDGGCNLFYQVYVNGAYYVSTGKSVTSYVLRFLNPSTTYTITVRAYDYGNNFGPLSSPLSVTTLAPNPNDHTAPNTPANLSAYGFGDGSTEMQISWAQSTDDLDAQANIRYDVYVNGHLEEVRFGSGGPVTAYGEFGQNTIEVIASDTAGNASQPSTVMISF